MTPSRRFAQIHVREALAGTCANTRVMPTAEGGPKSCTSRVQTTFAKRIEVSIDFLQFLQDPLVGLGDGHLNYEFEALGS